MTDEKKQTKAGATELNEEELNEVQGGMLKIDPGGKLGKKATKPAFKDGTTGAGETASK